MPAALGAASSLVLVELLIGVVIIIVVVLVVVAYFANPNGPPVAGPCGLVVRSWRKDYCSGNCGTAGQTCVVTATKPYAWGIGGATQAATCACATVIGVAPPGSVPGAAPSPGTPGSSVAPGTSETDPH